MPNKFFSFLFLNLLYSSLALCQFDVIEPEPFRLEDNYERDFRLDDQSIVDRFSYRFTPQAQLNWIKQGGQGFRITSGSVSNDETYTVAQLNKRWFFEDWLFGEIRHRRDEDYDTRFERTLFGTGVKFLEHYTFSVLGDVQAKKKDIDLHFEFGWYENPNDNNLINIDSDKLLNNNFNAGDRVRLAYILADNFYNGKANEGNYQKKPRTLFAEWLNFLSNKSYFHIWINYNLKTSYQNITNGSNLNYNQLRYGVSSLLYFNENVALYFKLLHEASERLQIYEKTSSDFRRDHTNFTFEFRYEGKLKNLYFIGAQYFYFDEDNINFNSKDPINLHSRNDFIFYSGYRYNITDKLRFRPTLYINKVDLENLSRASANLENDNNITGRIAFPFEYLFKNYNATLSVMPTLEWPGSPFGGLNIQVQFLL